MSKHKHNLLPLREYQKFPFNKRFENLDKNVLIQMPTGTGKGNMIIHQIIKHIDNNQSVLVVVPNQELISNIGDRLKEQAPKYYNYYFHPIYSGSEKIFDTGITVGIYKSLYNAFKAGYIRQNSYSSIIHDECHRVASRTHSELFKLKGIHTGYTATPNRLDGKPLSDYFDDIYMSPSLDWFIANGYLAPYKLFSAGNIEISENIKTFNDQLDLQQKILNNKISIGETIDHWERLALGEKTIVFASGIEHGKNLTTEFNERFNGKYIFGFLDGKTPKTERETILQQFRDGQLTGIINVAILIEGVDISDATCVILDRFTNSVSRYLQMVGRVLRYQSNKQAIIIDRVGNALMHGSPSYDHEWSLSGKTVVLREYTYNCYNCNLPLINKGKVARKYPDGITIDCPNCGTENFFKYELLRRVKQPKEIENIDRELVEFTANSSTLKIYKILNGKQMVQYKVNKILNLEAETEIKIKALKLLGVDETRINLYLN